MRFTRPAHHTLARVCVWVGLVLLGSACNRTEGAVPPGARDFEAPFSEPAPTAIDVPFRTRLLADSTTAQLDQMVAQLLTQRDQFLENAMGDPSRLAQLEHLFIHLGRLGDLLDVYRSAVAEAGSQSPFAPRLAMLYTVLGFLEPARQLLEPALEAQPDNPDAHFAMAFLRHEEAALERSNTAESDQEAPADEAADAEMRLQLERLLALSPRYDAIALPSAVRFLEEHRELPAGQGEEGTGSSAE